MTLVTESVRRRGVAFMPIPPYSPHLNLVEGAVNIFKQAVSSILLSAASREGPITNAWLFEAAVYACCTLERFVKVRRGETYRGKYIELKSLWWLSTGAQPRLDRLVRFGAAGYAYVDKNLRQSRGTPAYIRAEPVLLVGYQNMYTHVYQCLTRHGTKIFCEQVRWDLEAPLGQMLPIGGEACLRTLPTRLPADTPLFPTTETTDAKDAREGGIAEFKGASPKGHHQRRRPRREHTHIRAGKGRRRGQGQRGHAIDNGQARASGAALQQGARLSGRRHGAPSSVHRGAHEALDGVPLAEATNKRRYTGGKGIEQPYNKTDHTKNIQVPKRHFGLRPRRV